jgi:hypothetical protein
MARRAEKLPHIRRLGTGSVKGRWWRIGLQSQYFRIINKIMYVQRYSVAHSHNHCYNGNATVRSLFIAIGVDVAVNNIKVFTVVMELQQWVLLYCCRAIQHLVPLTIVSIKHYQCASVFLPSLLQIASFCAEWYCHMRTVCLYYNFPHYLIYFY